MPERLYTLWLDERSFVHVEFLTVRGRVVSFIVRLMIQVGEQWFNAVRYDTAHGLPHRDMVDRDGQVWQKDWLTGFTFEEALTHAKNDLVENYEAYIKIFETR